MNPRPKKASDKRYLRCETKIQRTIDNMFKDKKMVTKVTDFCFYAGINPTTFYNHYSSIGEAILCRDLKESDELKAYLASNLKLSSSIKIKTLFRKTFRYIRKHKTYFEGVAARDNIRPFKGVMTIAKPILLNEWRNYREWDAARNIRLECVYNKLTFEIASEYNEWIQVDKFNVEKVQIHIRRLVYLTSTACQRLDR